MKISYINSLCVKNDAISNSIRDEIIWLQNKGINDVCLYSYECDFKELPFTKVCEIKDIAFDHRFQSSDLVIFHFGVFYPLFNLLPIVPVKAKCLVVFHNITPKQFVSRENHVTIDKSFSQMANITFADHVACVSQTNLDVLRVAGIQTPATVLPLAIHNEFKTPESKPSSVDQLIRIVFIGRFVKSKGPKELLEAIKILLKQSSSKRLQIDLVGNLSFSDSNLFKEIQDLAKELQQLFEDRINIMFHGNAMEDVKQSILRNADLFVLPTYHEGFCVPILEALANGCKVITYENSNTPAICSDFARLVPTGDVGALSNGISEAIEEILSPQWLNGGSGSYTEYSQNTWQYVQNFFPDPTEKRFIQLINTITA